MYKSTFLAPDAPTEGEEEAVVVWPTEAKAMLSVDCVTEVMPNQALDIEEGSMRIVAMIEMLKSKQGRTVEQIAHNLPSWLRESFENETFMQECVEKFETLDRDLSGRIEAQELYPVILELAEEHPLSITEEHCDELLQIFDKDGNGYLDVKEFVDFIKFVFTISWLNYQAETEQQGG